MLPRQRLQASSSGCAPGRVTVGEDSTPATSSCAAARPAAAHCPSAITPAAETTRTGRERLKTVPRPRSEHAQRPRGVEPTVNGLGLPQVIGQRLVGLQLGGPVVLIG